MAKIIIYTPSPEAANTLRNQLNNPLNAVDAVTAANNTVQATINFDRDAAIDLLIGLVTAQPWYIGMGLNAPTADAIKQAARLLEGRQNQIDSAVSAAISGSPDPLVPTTVYVRRDPLILDLDGDGIEITPLSGNVMFDTNGDTIKTATAWVSGDDGILVWDRNGNGTIDSGAEIFGDEMIMSNGQKAQNGFEALKAMNSDNNGDLNTVFDARDGLYSAVRIWRDLNQDGISQANELQTLAAAGVASIGLSYGSPTLQNGSTPAYVDASMLAEGSFTRANGTVGQAGSFLLTQNNSIREFTPVTVSQAALVLPNIQGSGVVRDLREAA